MEILVYAGSALAILGVLGLAWCILTVARARRAGLPDAEMRARLQKVVALNLGALAVSALGLMLVMLGLALG
jgi:hypothetical protein